MAYELILLMKFGPMAHIWLETAMSGNPNQKFWFFIYFQPKVSVSDQQLTWQWWSVRLAGRHPPMLTPVLDDDVKNCSYTFSEFILFNIKHQQEERLLCSWFLLLVIVLCPLINKLQLATKVDESKHIYNNNKNSREQDEWFMDRLCRLVVLIDV